MVSTGVRLGVMAVVLVATIASNGIANAQRQQYKIQPSGVVLKLKRIDVTTFKYEPFGQAQLRRDGEGNAIWYFKADTGKEYTAPAPDQPPAATRYTADELTAAFQAAQTGGQIPTAVRVEVENGKTTFIVKFERNKVGLRWHSQVGMTAQEYEIVNRTLTGQSYQSLFAEPYVAGDKSTRFVAAWRK